MATPGWLSFWNLKPNFYMNQSQKFREVIFTVEAPSTGCSFDGYEYEPEKKKGYFYQLSNRPIYDREAYRYVDQTLAIIEEISTGKMYEILPEWIQFVTPIEQD